MKNIDDGAWVGLNDRDIEGIFTWCDGTPVSQFNCLSVVCVCVCVCVCLS